MIESASVTCGLFYLSCGLKYAALFDDVLAMDRRVNSEAFLRGLDLGVAWVQQRQLSITRCKKALQIVALQLLGLGGVESEEIDFSFAV